MLINFNKINNKIKIEDNISLWQFFLDNYSFYV